MDDDDAYKFEKVNVIFTYCSCNCNDTAKPKFKVSISQSPRSTVSPNDVIYPTLLKLLVVDVIVHESLLPVPEVLLYTAVPVITHDIGHTKL